MPDEQATSRRTVRRRSESGTAVPVVRANAARREVSTQAVPAG
ncbi:hypothetical protein [Haloarcula brevis]